MNCAGCGRPVNQWRCPFCGTWNETDMTLSESKRWLGPAYVFHKPHQWKDYPHHSAYALVDVRATVERVKAKQQSFSSAVEEHRQKLRLVYGKAAA